MLVLFNMKQQLENLLFTWPNQCIRDVDLITLLRCSENARYSLIKRALKNKQLTLLKRGLYLIEKPYRKLHPNLFEAAQLFYGPSYISLESALSYHQWIPEAVYTINSATVKRSNHFKTPFGNFNFLTIPTNSFYLGVDRIVEGDSTYLMAHPWKALADYIYIYNPKWNTLLDAMADLRIEPENLKSAYPKILTLLATHYPNKRVRKILTFLNRES